MEAFIPGVRASRIYWRNQGGARRAYADFPDSIM
jgi:hypothetical protein